MDEQVATGLWMNVYRVLDACQVPWMFVLKQAGRRKKTRLGRDMEKLDQCGNTVIRYQGTCEYDRAGVKLARRPSHDTPRHKHDMMSRRTSLDGTLISDGHTKCDVQQVHPESQGAPRAPRRLRLRLRWRWRLPTRRDRGERGQRRGSGSQTTKRTSIARVVCSIRHGEGARRCHKRRLAASG
jgi:hypothetical protein